MKSKRRSFVLRFSRKEREAIAAAASARGMEAPAWARQVLLFETARALAGLPPKPMLKSDFAAVVDFTEDLEKPPGQKARRRRIVPPANPADDQPEVITLSHRDWRHLMKALKEDTGPSASLLAAWRRYRAGSG